MLTQTTPQRRLSQKRKKLRRPFRGTQPKTPPDQQAAPIVGNKQQQQQQPGEVETYDTRPVQPEQAVTAQAPSSSSSFAQAVREARKVEETRKERGADDTPLTVADGPATPPKPTTTTPPRTTTTTPLIRLNASPKDTPPKTMQQQQQKSPPRLLAANVKDTPKKERIISIRNNHSSNVDPPSAQDHRPETDRPQQHANESTPPTTPPTRNDSSNDNNNNDNGDVSETTARFLQAYQSGGFSQTPPLNKGTPVRTNKQQNSIQDNPVQTALQRPLGRHRKPNHWVVEVSQAEWDADTRKWKYRILVQKRQLLESSHSQDNNKNNTTTHSSSFTNAFTWRSVADFFWLQQALRSEYHGALLVPVLSIALGRTASVANEMPVESDLLAFYLDDILNHTRGRGEWSIPSCDVKSSTSMERFLYKNILPETGGLDKDEGGDGQDREGGEEESVFLQCGDETNRRAKTVLDHFLQWNDKLCGAPQPEDEEGGGTRRRPAVELLNCTSRALGSARELEVQDSMADTASMVSSFANANHLASVPSSSSALHSELVYAANDLAKYNRKLALSCMEKLQAMSELEKQVGLAWKRLASCILSLFVFEKEAEGRSSSKHFPYRKISQELLEEHLSKMIAIKTERGAPALTHLSAMMQTYIADLSSVEPSVEEYDKAVRQFTTGAYMDETESSVADSTSVSSNSNSSWEEIREWTMKNLQKANLASPDPNTIEMMRRKKQQQKQFELRREQYKERVTENQRLLRASLKKLFLAAPFRISRMAWKYWSTEASQCALMKSAAATLRSKLDVVSQSSVSKMLKRHSRDEKTDHPVEMELIQKIVNLGQNKKFNYDSGTDGSVSTTSINNELVEVDNDDFSVERSKAVKRDKALDVARQKLGRWDAQLAMAIMEAVGVEDPNVRVEETTRDLRSVRKYAIGLRENLNSCVEATHLLQELIAGSDDSKTNSNKGPPANRLLQVRMEFVSELTRLFSGKFDEPKKKHLPKRSRTSKSILLDAGIETSDPMGWLPTFEVRSNTEPFAQGKLGDLAVHYAKTRDAQVEWLLSSLLDLLNDYYQRIEVVEGFVYMECVGIQLEKHFNSKRTRALSLFEKKTDINAALAVAKKKRKQKVVEELEEKALQLGPDVSHTTVKETKEAHLESKNLKAALHDLAMRRLQRAKESSTERVVNLVTLWAKEEELNSAEEIKSLGSAIANLEQAVSKSNEY